MNRGNKEIAHAIIQAPCTFQKKQAFATRNACATHCMPNATNKGPALNMSAAFSSKPSAARRIRSRTSALARRRAIDDGQRKASPLPPHALEWFSNRDCNAARETALQLKPRVSSC